MNTLCAAPAGSVKKKKTIPADAAQTSPAHDEGVTESDVQRETRMSIGAVMFEPAEFTTTCESGAGTSQRACLRRCWNLRALCVHRPMTHLFTNPVRNIKHGTKSVP